MLEVLVSSPIFSVGSSSESKIQYTAAVVLEQEVFSVGYRSNSRQNKLVNTQNVSLSETVDSHSIQCAESKYGRRIQFWALVVMIHEVRLNA